METDSKYNDVLTAVPLALQPIAVNIIGQLITIDEMEAPLHMAISADGAVEKFENGKQRMLRASPATKTWLDLLKQRMALLDRLTKLVPKSARGETEPEEQDELAEYIDARADD